MPWSASARLFITRVAVAHGRIEPDARPSNAQGDKWSCPVSVDSEGLGFHEVHGDGRDPKHGISQDDIYQLCSYGRRFGYATAALIYPRTPNFERPLRYEFNDEVAGQGLELLRFPFDVVQPGKSVREIMHRLAGR